MSDGLTGVWMHSSGARVEIAQDGAEWRTCAYMSPTGGTPAGEHIFDEEAKIRDCITGLESQGYARDPEREPDGHRTWRDASAAQWQSPGHVIGALIAFVVIVLIGVMVINASG